MTGLELVNPESFGSKKFIVPVPPSGILGDMEQRNEFNWFNLVVMDKSKVLAHS